MFNTFPEDLDGVEEVIHECRAQADLCMGIDEEVYMYLYIYIHFGCVT